MLLVLRNAFEILVLTAVNHSETDWNIQHSFRIWAYTDYFGSPRTPLMSVFGVRSECAETPEKNKKSEIAKKKFGSLRFWRVGRSTANGQNFKDGLSGWNTDGSFDMALSN